ncbi:MAG TPA: flavin reductase, partial [Anaerovoracaceae bacterium]|nr:flavin reductase [Anaerovoracaceae bacterium]
MNTKMLFNLSYGLYIISAMDKERPTGCTANSLVQITADPMKVALSMNRDNYTNKCIRESGKYGVVVLAQDSDPSLIGGFGFRSGKDANKFDGLEYEVHSDVPVIKAGIGYMVFKVVDSMEVDTHTIFIGELIDAEEYAPATPMTYSYYHNVIKGKSPKNAPTYVKEEPEEEKKDKDVWVCTVCGYEYDGDVPFEDLPDTYKCPI